MVILAVFVGIALLILIHEFGHFVVAKLSGILVEEFGFGFPPRIFAKKIGETVYSINLLPFGGFVKMFGENVPIKAKIENIRGYSAHADSDGLVAFVKNTKKKVKKVFLTMGEPRVSNVLANRLYKELNVDAVVPQEGEQTELQ